jgi:hypothetical protein
MARNALSLARCDTDEEPSLSSKMPGFAGIASKLKFQFIGRRYGQAAKLLGSTSSNCRRSFVDLFVVGSCRILRPLRYAQDNRLIKITNNDGYWFTHSAKDCLQYLDFLEGKAIPAELFDLVVGTGSVKPNITTSRYNVASHRHAASVIEISTYKILKYRGWSLHLDQFRIKCRELNLHPDTLANELQTPLDRRDGSFLDKYEMPDFYRALFRETVLVIDTDAELHDDIASIRHRVGGPMVFVDHFNIPREDGTLFPERDRLTTSLKRYTAEFGVKLYETAPAILEYGLKEALVDINHYAESFDRIVAARLLEMTTAAAGELEGPLAIAS